LTRARSAPRGKQLFGGILLLVIVAAIIAAVPRLGEIMQTLADVRWGWAAVAVLANVASLLVRGLGWQALLRGALGARHVGAAAAQRSYLVGQLVNAVLLGRIGEASKIAVYIGHLDEPETDWGVVAGTVVAHRMLDTVPLSVLILLLALSVGVPGWTVAVLGVSALLLLGGLLLASKSRVVGGGRIAMLIGAVRHGLGVLRSPGPAAISVALQSTGWLIEIVGVWSAFKAFGIEEGPVAAGLVVVATNAATLVPFVPGSVGVFQVAVAGVLKPVGVEYTLGLAFGIALQAIETLATLTAGLPSAAMEGVSLQSLWQGPPEGSSVLEQPCEAGPEV